MFRTTRKITRSTVRNRKDFNIQHPSMATRSRLMPKRTGKFSTKKDCENETSACLKQQPKFQRERPFSRFARHDGQSRDARARGAEDASCGKSEAPSAQDAGTAEEKGDAGMTNTVLFFEGVARWDFRLLCAGSRRVAVGARGSHGELCRLDPDGDGSPPLTLSPHGRSACVVQRRH